MSNVSNKHQLNDIPDVQIVFTELEKGDTNIQFGDDKKRQFKISDILKYVLKDQMIDINTNDETFFHIKKIFFNYDKKGIIFRSYDNSPITGNLEILLNIAKN